MDKKIDDFESLCREVIQTEIKLKTLTKDKEEARARVIEYLKYKAKDKPYTTKDGMRVYSLNNLQLVVTGTEFYK